MLTGFPIWLSNSNRENMNGLMHVGAGLAKRLCFSYPLKQMYDGAIVFTSEALRHLTAEVGSDWIVIGTDCPYPGRVPRSITF